MLDYIRKNIVKQIKRAIPILRKKDSFALKELSNRTIHSASVYQDQSSLVFALTIYSLSKIVERCSDSAGFDSFIDRIIKYLEDSRDLLLMDKIDDYKIKRSSLLKSISQMDRKFSIYVEEVIDKAKIKKGSKLYEHGISIRRAADLLGISQWELMNYIGKTEISEYKAPAVSVKNRLAYARKIFNI